MSDRDKRIVCLDTPVLSTATRLILGSTENNSFSRHYQITLFLKRDKHELDFDTDSVANRFARAVTLLSCPSWMKMPEEEC